MREIKKPSRTVGGQVLKRNLISSPLDKQTNGQMNRHFGREQGKQLVIFVRFSSAVSCVLDVADGS